MARRYFLFSKGQNSKMSNTDLKKTHRVGDEILSLKAFFRLLSAKCCLKAHRNNTKKKGFGQRSVFHFWLLCCRSLTYRPNDPEGVCDMRFSNPDIHH